ncbi:MAG: hypothetical protein K2N94_08140 [Lachnospiraceae bacterium]|nr:hypothetical protein [Lachnospiraceae bacterium]
MDYRDYINNLKRYNELDSAEFEKGSSREAVIQRLIDISFEKKRIKTENNAVIREFISKYEDSFELLDAPAAAALMEFMDALIPNASSFLDVPVTYRIAKLLLRYYQEAGDTEAAILMLERCTVFDIIIKEHLDDYEASPYARTAEEYLDRFDELSERPRRAVVNCWLLGIVDRKNLTFGLQRYPQIKARFERIRQRAGEQFMEVQYIMCKQNILAFALEACRRASHAKKTGAAGTWIDLKKEAPLIEELAADLEGILGSEHTRDMISDKVVARLYCAQAAYHLGMLSLEELLGRFEEYAAPHEEYNAMEQFSSLFTANSYYMDYLYRCSDYDKGYIFEKSMDIATRVLEASKHMVHRYGNYQVNSCVLMFINTASNIVDFNFFKSTMLGATVYANKALYIHTLMAKEISLVILKYILEHDPKYLDGVGGHRWEYCRDHKQEILDLMENCALFHDIGKYFCLDYVSNSSRNLTDDEFAVIKAHPANFSKIYRGANSPEVVCIHDCALLHHVWYNGQGGYPKEKHTANQPFINIISIADSIDAATDNIGRPYGTGKTLEQLMTEFESQRDTRYCGYICDLLHADEVKRAIEYMINTKRKEINYRVYLGLEEGQ